MLRKIDAATMKSVDKNLARAWRSADLSATTPIHFSTTLAFRRSLVVAAPKLWSWIQVQEEVCACVWRSWAQVVSLPVTPAVRFPRP